MTAPMPLNFREAARIRTLKWKNPARLVGLVVSSFFRTFFFVATLSVGQRLKKQAEKRRTTSKRRGRPPKHLLKRAFQNNEI
jgi:hypothetical protein